MIEKLKKLLPENAIPLGIICFLFLVSIVGYSLEKSGTPEQVAPERVLFKTKGGNVIFSHKKHTSEYGAECSKCHHGKEIPSENYKCRRCHNTRVFNSICESKPPHVLCIGTNCIACHKTQAGLDEKNCKFCHK